VSAEISDAFIKQYESDVHMAYQRQGSKLRSMVRTKNGVVGSSTTFQKVGTGEAVQKARHAELATMNIAHDPIECTLADWYAGDYIDKLDELKTNIDERLIAASSAAYALGRKTDSLLTTALDAATSAQTEGGTDRLTEAKIKVVHKAFGNNDVPYDNERYWAVGPCGWQDLLGITAFSSQDYVGQDQLPYKMGMTAKRWYSFLFFEFSGLPVASDIRKTWAWHRSALGHAIGCDVKSEINYIPTRVAHLATSMMSMGAIIIDNRGIYETEVYEG
jgi:hypothetical protein